MEDKNIKVLLVEDSSYYAYLAEKMLNQLRDVPFKLVWADTLQKGLHHLKKEKFDVILLDLTLPDGSGLNTFTKMHTNAPKIPIIVLTGIADESLANKALHEGAQDYLVKGEVDIKWLQRSIRYAIERHKIKREIQSAQEKYEKIFDNSAVAITVTDEKHRIISWNKFTEDMLGMNKDDLYLKHVSFLYPQEEWEKIMSYKIERKEIEPHLETQMIKKNGELIDVDVSISVLKDEVGTITGSIGVTRDITDRKHMEERLKEYATSLEEMVAERTRELEAEKDRVQKLLYAKTEFITQVSHDLRTPLTPLTTLLPLIKPHLTDEKCRERYKIVWNSVEYLRNLVVSTLNLSKLETDSVQFEVNPVRLNEIVCQVTSENNGQLENTDLKLENMIPADIIVLVDKLRVMEVLHNLVDNAVKYSPAGGQLRFSAQAKGDFVEVSVVDNGLGMEEDQLDKIFTSFYRVDKSRHDLSTGLGLTICKNIIEKHGGRIWAESNGLGKGTTIKFTLPISQN